MLIGQQKERNTLKNCVESDKSEFVALYGRRQVSADIDIWL